MSVTHALPGKLIVFEGLDGSGTTTQAERLVRWLAGQNRPALYTREPTNGPIGAMLRLHVQKRLTTQPRNGPAEPLHEETVALAFAADRLDHVHNEIQPLLAEGVAVVADRFYLSSLAYQSLTLDYAWVKTLNARATRPDLTIFLAVPPDVCKARLERDRHQVDQYEELAKLREVAQSYERAVQDLQADGEPIVTLDGQRPIEAVHATVLRLVEPLFAPPTPGLRE